MRFDASPCPEKGVCYLQGLARTSVKVDVPPFEQIWFRSVIRDRRTCVLTDRATGKHLPSSPRYLRNKTKTFQTFVMNRFQQIKDISEVGRWRYVSFALNEGDDTSRGLSVKA